MRDATISLGVVLSFLLAAVVALFWLDQPAAAWACLVVALLGVLCLLGMIASTATANRAR